MTTTIALAGKGGVGKTTISGMVVKYLMQTRTIGDIRENLLSQVKASLTAGGAAMGSVAGGVSKREFLEYEIRTSLSEGERFDLIAMGQPEGPGCYCAVNHNLRGVIDSMSRNYRHVVIDNEAGMEHLSRRTTRDVQHLLIVTDPTHRGIVAAERIASFRKEMDIHIENSYLILNRLVGEIPPPLQARIDEMDIPLLGTVPADMELAEFEFSGRPLVELGDASPVYRAVADFMERMLAA
jgi:CO dehydrogenase maturation factor